MLAAFHLGRGERVLVGLQQRVDLLALDAGREVLVGVDGGPAGNGSLTFVQASGAIARKPSTFAANAGRTGFKQSARSRNRVSAVLQTACSSASLPSCLASSQGLRVVDELVRDVGQAHDFAQRAAVVTLVRVGTGTAWANADSYSRVTSRSLAPSLPSKRLPMKPAQRLAMLTNLPTRSELTFGDHVVEAEVDVSMVPLDLAAK